MEESKVIVGMKKDGDGGILNVGDYGLVGDLLEMVGELREGLKN
ncbi:hypothetical protein [Neisseria sicca]